MSQTRARAKVKPYKFTKKIETLPGEQWKNINIKDLLGCYKISNFGRIKRLRHTHKGKEWQEMILTPFRKLSSKNLKFRIIIRNKNLCVQDLVYSSFKTLKRGFVAECKDGDRRNIALDNLKQVASTWKRIDSHLAQQAKSEKRQKPLFVQINIHDGDKETNLMQVKAMRKEGYCSIKESNGIYDFRLIPKEGDTVRVTETGNKYTIEKKYGRKYTLKGYEQGYFFLAEELEIIKQS